MTLKPAGTSNRGQDRYVRTEASRFGFPDVGSRVFRTLTHWRHGVYDAAEFPRPAEWLRSEQLTREWSFAAARLLREDRLPVSRPAAV